MIRTICILVFLSIALKGQAQQLTSRNFPILRPAYSIGLEYQVLSAGGEGSEGEYAKGLFIGVPIHIMGRGKNRLIMQPDISLFLVNEEPKSIFNVQSFAGFGANVAFKYTRINERNRFAIGPRIGYQRYIGLIGLTFEYDYRFSQSWMIGINANTQFYPDAYTEGYSGFKLQLTKIIYR
jgi:hypothetical protein